MCRLGRHCFLICNTRTLCACRYVCKQTAWTNLLPAHTLTQAPVPCLSFQRFFKHSVNINHRGISSSGCYRSFSSSKHSYLFWKTPILKALSPQKVIARSQQHDGKSLLDRFIFVRTLDNFYEDVPDGIILDTAYADSRPGEDYESVVPVVVGIHDTPGSHQDLVPLLNRFAKLGCRTIAPTFPGHGNTMGLMAGFDDVFCQSTVEKAAFIHDFLSDLGIERVDLLIGVGAACYPMLQLCVSDSTSKFYRCMVFISPWPFQRPRYEPNHDLTKRIQYMWDRPFFRPPARLLLPAYKVGQVKGTREKVTTAYLLSNLDLAEASGLALAAASMNVPRIVMFGEMDPAVEKELYEDVLDRLGIPKNNVSLFKGRLDSPRLPGALVFPDGGYDLHLQQTGIISAFLIDIVTLFHPHIRI